jgi:hypothetical protein
MLETRHGTCYRCSAGYGGDGVPVAELPFDPMIDYSRWFLPEVDPEYGLTLCVRCWIDHARSLPDLYLHETA